MFTICSIQDSVPVGQGVSVGDGLIELRALCSMRGVLVLQKQGKAARNLIHISSLTVKTDGKICFSFEVFVPLFRLRRRRTWQSRRAVAILWTKRAECTPARPWTLIYHVDNLRATI